ncbi:hypothetical protein ACFSSA_10395 [Luteolibacter algae]|uniref:Cell division protein FtsX n=1 Tax=Luteolibacter algae TaxID=454151 RepID=A0ABW5D9J7_9BACT
MENKESQEVSQKSPFAGCAILITALLVMLFLIGFSVVILFRQFGEIAKFTEERPNAIEVVVVEDREAELNRLAEKIERFRLDVNDDKSAVLDLNVEEMNLAIAAYDSFKDLRGMFHVEEITPEDIRFLISFQLNGKPRLAKDGEGGLMTSDPRYLNGTLVATPGLLNNEVVLLVKNIETEKATVPREFLEQMSPYRIAEKYIGSEGLGTTMAKLTNVSLGDGYVRFEKVSGKIPEDTITNEQVDAGSRKVLTFLGVAATVFLFFVSLILLLGHRLRKKRQRDEQGG